MIIYISFILIFIGNVMLFYSLNLSGADIMGTNKGAILTASGVFLSLIGLFILIKDDPTMFKFVRSNWRFTI
jgi:hypothetical protein